MRRHALTDSGELVSTAEQRDFRMHMHINETRADNLSLGRNSMPCFSFREITDGGYLVALNADIRDKRFSLTGSVDDVPACNNCIKSHIFNFPCGSFRCVGIFTFFSVDPLSTSFQATRFCFMFLVFLAVRLGVWVFYSLSLS